MQTRQPKLIFIIAICLSMTGCFSDRRDVFDQAIDQAKMKGLNQVVEAGVGLPFFASKNLDPVWDEQASIVKIPKLSLRDHRGKEVSQDLFRGHISFVAFFFASCRGFCPTLLKNLQGVEKELKSQTNIKYIALTVDPANDDVKYLAQYAKKMKFSDRWHLLTGARDVIFSLARNTFASQAFQRAKEDGDRSFVHSEHFYMIDEEGRLRAVLNGTKIGVVSEARVAVERLASMTVTQR